MRLISRVSSRTYRNEKTNIIVTMKEIRKIYTAIISILLFLQAIISSTGSTEIDQDIEINEEFSGFHVEQQLQYFSIKSPKIVSYDYPMKISRDFGGPLSDHEPFSAELVLADPINACEPLKDAQFSMLNSFYYDRVVLAVRGECSFMQKTLNIQQAGAFAAFIYNNE